MRVYVVVYAYEIIWICSCIFYNKSAMRKSTWSLKNVSLSDFMFTSSYVCTQGVCHGSMSHVCTVTIPDYVIKQVNSIIYDLIWNGKTDKVINFTNIITSSSIMYVQSI